MDSKFFLTNREQCVELFGVRFDLRSVDCNVPQGSILGPLLFLLYVDDMPSIVKKSNVRLYADVCDPSIK